MQVINKILHKEIDYLKQKGEEPKYLILDDRSYKKLLLEMKANNDIRYGEKFDGMIIAVTQYHTEYELIEVF